MKKTVDIFIKSYKPDFWLLQLALQTIKKNVTGYNNIILLIPEKDKHDFDTRNMPDRTLIYYVEDRQPGWLMQQYFKMTAYNYSDADFILFSDSDCLFTRPVNVQDYIKDDKPEILYTEWSLVGDAICWKKPTEDFFGEEVAWEGMRRNQLIYHRSTLVNISKYKPDLEHVIMTSHKFSEFNVMSWYAYKFENDKYRFVSTQGWEYVPPMAEQSWSHCSKAKDASETHLREYIRMLETIMKAFNVPVPNK